MALKRWLPVSILVLGLALFFILGGQKYLSFAALKQHYQGLMDFTYEYYSVSVLIYIGIYIAIVAFSIPGATIMTLIGGFLFGWFWGTLWVVSSATIGACLVFLAVKSAFGESLRHKATGVIHKMRSGFEKNAFNYLLSLRLIPVFTFFVINIAAGVLNVKLRDFSGVRCLVFYQVQRFMSQLAQGLDML